MSATTTPTLSAQRQRATALYRALWRTTRDLFARDVAAVTAAHAETRRRFAEGRALDAAALDASLDEGEQVVALLRHNVVQGEYSRDSGAYRLRFTPDTELGSNDTIRQPRPPTREEIAAARTFGCRRAFSTSARAHSVPRPVPRFPALVILADGSSIQMTSTSPRHLSRLTRDPTNHPVWNPALSGRTEGEADDDAGRLGRFRRRFADAQSVSFDTADLAWMSGGKEAAPGSPIQSAKAKAKGRK